ncbi:MAG: metallophosphoesterase family protein [Myxococcaceae bacterium]
MRLALLADIHANLHALEAVLRDVDGCGVDELVVLGDTINYGPRPRECLELVSARASVVLAGNHEKEAALPMPDELESDAREMLEWTVSQLAGSAPWETMRRTLLADANACAQVRRGELHFVHATAAKPFEQYLWPGHPNYHLQFNDQLDRYLVELLEGFSAVHSFVGHTHAPTVLTSYEHRELFPITQDWNRRLTFIGPRTVFYVPKGPLKLGGLAGKKLVINPGSVGQPRDQDPRASWAIYDGDSVEFRRVEYDHAATAKEIRALPLSIDTRRFFADRLAEGT